MKKHVLTLAMALAATGALAQANDTLAKIKASGTATMGVRDSSGRCPTPWAMASTPATTLKPASACWPMCRSSWPCPSWT